MCRKKVQKGKGENKGWISSISTDVTVRFLSNWHQAKHAVKPSVCRQHTEEQIPTPEEITYILLFETVKQASNQSI